MTPADLKGGRIAQVFTVGDETILIIEVKGKVLQAEVWRDPEGNAAGHLDISVIPGATSGAQVRLADSGDAAR